MIIHLTSQRRLVYCLIFVSIRVILIFHSGVLFCSTGFKPRVVLFVTHLNCYGHVTVLAPPHIPAALHEVALYVSTTPIMGGLNCEPPLSGSFKMSHH